MGGWALLVCVWEDVVGLGRRVELEGRGSSGSILGAGALSPGGRLYWRYRHAAARAPPTPDRSSAAWRTLVETRAACRKHQNTGKSKM